MRKMLHDSRAHQIHVSDFPPQKNSDYKFDSSRRSEFGGMAANTLAGFRDSSAQDVSAHGHFSARTLQRTDIAAQ
jgi:hypothetical protein